MKYYLLFILFLAPARLFCMDDETALVGTQEWKEGDLELCEHFIERIEHLVRFDFCQKRMEKAVEFVRDGCKKGIGKLRMVYEELEEREYYPITTSLALIGGGLVIAIKCFDL